MRSLAAICQGMPVHSHGQPEVSMAGAFSGGADTVTEGCSKGVLSGLQEAAAGERRCAAWQQLNQASLPGVMASLWLACRRRIWIPVQGFAADGPMQDGRELQHFSREAQPGSLTGHCL